MSKKKNTAGHALGLEAKDVAAEWKRQGKSIVKAAAAIGCSTTTVRHHLLTLGLIKRRKRR